MSGSMTVGDVVSSGVVSSGMMAGGAVVGGMVEVWRLWGPVIVVTLAVAPVAGAGVALVAAWRIRRGVPPRWAWTATGAEFAMVLGTAPWIWMVLTPRPGVGGVELVPVRGLLAVFAAGPATAVVQVGGNLLVFAALGALAPVRWPVGVGVVALGAGVGSVVVELLQHLLALGRVSSVDDVALNVAGAVLAALASRRWWRRRSLARRAVLPEP